MEKLYVLELVTSQGKLMAPDVYYESKEEVMFHIKSRAKLLYGSPYVKMFVRDGWTIADYGSHSLLYRFKKL